METFLASRAGKRARTVAGDRAPRESARYASGRGMAGRVNMEDFSAVPARRHQRDLDAKPSQVVDQRCHRRIDIDAAAPDLSEKGAILACTQPMNRILFRSIGGLAFRQ